MTEFSNHTQFPNSESKNFYDDTTHGNCGFTGLCVRMKRKGWKEEGEGEGEDEARMGRRVGFF